MTKVARPESTEELLHADHMLSDLFGIRKVLTASQRGKLDEFKTLLKLARAVVESEYIARDEAIDELEEFLR